MLRIQKQVVHPAAYLCIVSTCGTYAIKNTDSLWGIGIFCFVRAGFERQLRKHASGMFLGRGGIQAPLNAVRRTVGGGAFWLLIAGYRAAARIDN